MRIQRLDILRGVAVLLVLGRHLPVAGDAVAAPVRWVFDLWQRVGWIGVDLFFVLSGFLVSSLLFSEFRRHGELQPLRFLVRRALRIYPPFYAMLAMTVVVAYARDRLSSGNLRRFLAEALYVQNYVPGIWEHTWSLAVEEHFYLGLCVLLVALARRPATGDPFRPLLVIIPAWAAFALALRCFTEFRFPHSPYSFMATHLRADSLLWGVLLAYGYHSAPAAWTTAVRRRLGAIVPLSLLVLSVPLFQEVTKSSLLTTFGLTMLGLAFAGVVAVALTVKAARSNRRLARGAEIIGLDSYSIYLWHMPVSLWIVNPLSRGGYFSLPSPTLSYLLEVFVFVGTSVGIGIATARLIERPSLALRDRLFPSRSRAVQLPDRAVQVPRLPLVEPALAPAYDEGRIEETLRPAES